jgi:hypothetical protein
MEIGSNSSPRYTARIVVGQNRSTATVSKQSAQITYRRILSSLESLMRGRRPGNPVIAKIFLLPGPRANACRVFLSQQQAV